MSLSYGLRSIAFVAELIHPPVKHEPRGLQKLHSVLFDNSECSYRDFRLVAGGAQYSNSVGGLPGAPVSLVNVLADRIQMREEATGAAKDDFQVRLAAFAESALGNLPMQLFMVQQFCVRSVVNPVACNDARAFMLGTVLGYDEALLAPFAAAPSLAGLRFSFPPSGEQQGVFNVRIESYSHDNRSLFLENVGTFGRPITAGHIAELGARFTATYDFLQDHVLDFVAQFDGEEG